MSALQNIATYLTPDTLAALVSLTAMEVVLGIDNVVFIAILVGRLPKELQESTRKFGLLAALATRIALLFSISWVMGLTKPLFSLAQYTVSGRDLILLAGGLFLMAKATFEIHHKVEGLEQGARQGAATKKKVPVSMVILQISVLDIVFSLDSVITAVGMAENIPVMIVAMTMAMVVMLVFSGKIGHFVEHHPTIKILALSFLLLIGVMLVAEGTGLHIGKSYIYFAMFFSLSVELLNMRMRAKTTNS
jgi:predicted tellurium resistance membrane protein TerC